MGSPSSGSKVQTTMSVLKGKHQLSVSTGASLQLEKPENPSSTEKPSSVAAMSPRTTEEQSITAFLGDKKTKRRTRSSQGLELNGVTLGPEERTPLSSVSFRGHRRSGSGSVTPKASESPRAKAMCTTTGVDKYAVAKIAASLFHSPTKLERSMSLSRVAHRVVPGADGSALRSRTGVSDVILPDKRDTWGELKQQDSQRELESRLQAVVAQRSENGSIGNPCYELLEKNVEGSGAPLAVTGDVPSGNGNYEDSHCKATEVAMISSENPSHCLLGTVEDSWPNGEYLCSNGAHLPVKDIHPVCFETTHKQALTMSLDTNLREIARSCSLSTVASTQQPYLSGGSNELPACEPLHSELQSGNLSYGTDLENSHTINTPAVLPTSNSCSAGMELSYQDTKEVTLPGTCEALQMKVLVCNQGNEAEKNAQSNSSDKVDEAGLTEVAIFSSLVCENDAVLESKQVITDASQGKAVEEIHFNAEKGVGLREMNGSGACLRKSASFELGEKKTKVRKRRRSVSASGIGAMLLKIVRTSESDPPGTRSLPRAESEVSDASPPPPTTSLHQDMQFETETNNIEAVDMDVEYEDCSSELVAAAHIDTARVKDSSDKKDTEQPLEEAQLQLVDDLQLRKIQNCTKGGEAKLALRDSQEEDQTGGSLMKYQTCEMSLLSSQIQAGGFQRKGVPSHHLAVYNVAGSGSNDECDKRVISLENSDLAEEERFLDARDKSLDRCNSFESLETSSPSAHPPIQGACHEEKITNHESVVKGNVRVNGYKADIEDGSQRRRRRGRMPHDLDSSTVAIDDSRRSLSLVDENLCMIASLERSRSFVSMLQVSPRQSVDESTQSRLAPSSIAILTNPSFSSSHQDRLWEEQAEYSSGGRGTPGRDDETGFELRTPSPSGAISSDDQIRSAAASLRKGQDISCSGFASDSGRSHEKRKLGQSGRKRGRPQRSPLRNLLAAEDLHDKPTTHQRSPERRPFLQQILSRIRGKSSSPRSSPHKTSPTTPKRRHGTIWSSCMCFSHVK